MSSFLKNILNTKIDPVKEETLASVKSKTDLLTFEAGLKVDVVAGLNIGSKNISGSSFNPLTEDTLLLVNNKTSLLTFDKDSSLKTSGAAPALSSSVQVKDKSKTILNPASSEKIFLLSRMVKLMESQGTVGAGNLQRISIDAFGSGVMTGLGLSGDGVPLVTMASDYPTAITGVNTSANYMGWNSQIYKETARNTYAKSIRRRLSFT